MKILMATMGLDIGGAETHIVELAKELKRRGHDIAVASNGGAYVPEIEEAGIRHYSVPMNKRSIPLMAKSYFLMRKVLREEKPDVVHAHARIPAFICGLLKKTKKFPFVTTAHWVFDTGGALRWLSNWGDRTISVSEDIKEYLKTNYGVPDENIFVTINGMDTEKFSPKISGEKVRREFGIDVSAPVVSHVSRMDESRAFAARCLIDGAERLAGEVPGVVILIAGGGDVFDELSEKARLINEKLGRRCIIMAGPRTDVNEIVAAGDVFVGVSRAALEAMSASKPVVIAGNEGYMGVFTEDKLQTGIDGNFCCRGCPDTDTDTLISDTVSLFKMTEDEKNELGDYGRSVVMEHYSVARMAQDAENAYTSACPPCKAVMSGYYGFKNAGDEAILESVHAGIKRIVPGAQVTVLSNTPEETARKYGCRSERRFDPVRLVKTVRNCDVLVSGGGSLLQDATSTRSLMYYLLVMRLAEKMGKKVMLFANGIGPVTKKKNRKRVAKAASAADVITLRDPKSLEELKTIGVDRNDITVTADPVFLLDPAPESEADVILKANGVPEGPFMTVSVRPYGERAGFAEKVAGICDRIYAETGRNIVFVSMQPGTDEATAEEIRSHMTAPSYMISGYHDAEELMAVIGKSELALTMRLHSLIFAAVMAVPSVGFSYDPKTAAYLKMLDQPSAGDVENIDETAAMNAVRDILENREARSAELKKRRDELKLAAMENEKLLLKLIKG